MQTIADKKYQGISKDPIRLITNVIALAVSVLFAIKFFQLTNSNVINHYPFITSDGFDWYIEGIYLQYLGGSSVLPALPVLRPPGFVAITFLDSLIFPGLIISVIYGICLGGTYLLTLKIIELINPIRTVFNLTPPLLLLLLTFHPANYIKKYLLSDSVAVTLSLLSVYLLLRFWKNNKKSYLITSVLVAFTASVTQTYTLLPYLVFCGYFLLTGLKNRKFHGTLVLSCITVTALYVLTTYLWRASITHGMTPTNLQLLKFSLDMSSFYLNTWSIYLLPLIPFLFATRSSENHFSKSELIIPIVITAFIFGALCFFYQWKEARFSYYFWPWIAIIIGTFLSYSPTKKNIICLLLFGIGCVIINPRNHWVPQLNQLSSTPKTNWLVDFSRSSFVDRKLLSCIDPSCTGNQFVSNADNYVKSTITVYQKLLSKNK
jgi:hypothetical protein